MKKGFSLLETTVALAVLLTSVVGPLTLASFSLRSASVAKNSLIAAGLAQEGLELVRTARSSNILKNADWLTGLGFCLNSSASRARTSIVICGIRSSFGRFQVPEDSIRLIEPGSFINLSQSKFEPNASL